MKTVTTTRIVLTPSEREIRKTWGSQWPRMRREATKYGRISILVGNWSFNGRTYHTSWLPKPKADAWKLFGIGFSDNTSLHFMIQQVTIEELLNMNLKQIIGYERIIRDAEASGEEWYYV